MSTYKILTDKVSALVEELHNLEKVDSSNTVEITTSQCNVRVALYPVYHPESSGSDKPGSDKADTPEKPAPKKRTRKAKAKPTEPVEPTESTEPVEPVEPVDLDDALLDEPGSTEVKTKYTKDEMLDVLRSTIKSDPDNRAAVRAFLKDELGANNTDELKVKDYPAIVQKCIDLGYTDE